MAERINISTVENKPSDYSQYTRSNLYLDTILPFQKERFMLAYQEGQNQIKNDQDKQAYRLHFIDALDQQIAQSNSIKSNYLQQYNQATDDAQKQAIDQSFQEQVARFNARNNIDLSNAASGRAIATAKIGAQSNYEQALIQAGAKINAGNNAIEKQQIQTLAAAEREGPLKNDLQTLSDIMKNPISGQGGPESYQAITQNIGKIVGLSGTLNQPTTINEMANVIAEPKDMSVVESALQAAESSLSPAEYQNLVHKVMVLKDIPTGSLGVSSATSSTQSMSGGGYLNPAAANVPFTAPTGQELEQGRNRAAFYSQQVIPEINDLDQQTASLQARRDALMNSVLQYQPPNGIQAAQQLNGQMFGTPAIHRKPTSQFSIAQPQDIAPLSEPAPLRQIMGVPVEYQKAPQASTGGTGHRSIRVAQQQTIPQRPPESPAPGPTVPNPQPYVYHGPNYGPEQPAWSYPGSIKYGPGQTTDFPPTYQPPQTRPTSGNIPLERPTPEQHFQGIPGMNPVPTLDQSQTPPPTNTPSVASQLLQSLLGQPQSYPAPPVSPSATPVPPSKIPTYDRSMMIPGSKLETPTPAPIQVQPQRAVPPKGSQTPSPPPDLKSETGDTGQAAMNEAKQKKTDFVNQALRTAQDYQSKPDLVDRLLKNDPVSRSAAIVYRTNKENNKPLSETISTMMSAHQGDPASQQKALAAIFYLSHQSNTSDKIPV